MRILPILLFALAACGRPAERSPTPAASETLPSNGAPLFAFMLERLPELVNKVPCSCCNYTIGECYRGACPPTCGACNLIGRDVYNWHQQGAKDADIIDGVKIKYGINR